MKYKPITVINIAVHKKIISAFAATLLAFSISFFPEALDITGAEPLPTAVLTADYIINNRKETDTAPAASVPIPLI